MNILSFIDRIVIILFLYIRTYTFFWLIKNKEKYIKERHICDYLPIRSLLSYTAFGTYLSFFTSSYTEIFGVSPSSCVLCITWINLFTTTVAYYVFIFPDVIKEGSPFGFTQEIMGHGPLLLLNAIRSFYVEKFFNLTNLFYSIGFAYWWFIFIWGPWFYFTGDSVYPILNNCPNFYAKLKVTFKVAVVPCIGFSIGYFIY